MKNLSNLVLFGLVISVAIACSGKKEVEGDPAIYAEANDYLQKSLDLREEITGFEKQVKASNIDYSDLKEELKTWDKDIIEVPGHEHSHDDDHAREYHIHNPIKPFKDSEHLDYQKVMHAEIIQLHEKFKILTLPKIMEEVK
ncbi:hypothetical protein M3O96_03755 [Aquiflexum sp. TKW24L]|uniref:hypothetical protein n=1 Tax=Aquiflexum sp. TKW24L TaxID=2942212 RepID=UPI0020BF1787|nr:hypothetical protein [Aquiflexum sp. TKW24L]MCL6258186.1 hypothetical protein [Aquiflexum sp. TKW24L]